MKNNVKKNMIFITWIRMIFQCVYLRSVVGENKYVCTTSYMWDQTIKKCIPCLRGHFGENCKIECPYPYHGLKCQQKCNCDIRDCHYVDGCRLQSDQNNNSNITTTSERRNETLCLVNYKWSFAEQTCIPCDPGYFGINCDTKCPRLRYGFNCLSQCECSEHDCDHVYGCTQTSRDFSKDMSNTSYGYDPTLLLRTIENIEINDSESNSHVHPFETDTTRNIHDFVVNRENLEMEAGHKDIDNNSESTARIEPARIGIILLTIVSVVILLLIICTYPLEKYQSTKYRQENV